MEYMKEIRITGILALLLIAFANSASAQAVNSALSLATFSTSPHTAIAGENITLTFQLYNSYTENLRNVIMQVSATNPIINVSPGATQLVSTIPAGTYAGYFTYKFHIPSTLQAGEYEVDVLVSYTTASGGGVSDVPGQSTIPIDFYVYGNPNIQLTANPVGDVNTGGFTTFDISAINTGTDTARNVSISVINSANFSASGSTNQNLGIMSPGSSTSTTVSLLTSANLSEGTNYIPVMISYTAQSGLVSNNIVNVPINFVTGSPNIVATIKSAIPSQISAGTNQTLTVQVQNLGSGTAKNVSLAFMDSQGINVAGSPSTFFISSLGAGNSTTLSVLINANRNDNETSYSLPLLISYQNANHQNNASKTSYLPIILQGSAVFNISAVYGQIVAGGTYQPITFTIRNTGNEAAQQISLSLQTIYPITPATPTYFINSLAAGQSTNVTFYVTTDTHGSPGTYPLTIYEQWTQPNGYSTQQYSSSNNYYAKVSGGTSGGSTDWIVYVIVIVAIVGAIAYLQKTKKIDIKAMISKFQQKKK